MGPYVCLTLLTVSELHIGNLTVSEPHVGNLTVSEPHVGNCERASRW